jgi:ribose transport system permease protein
VTTSSPTSRATLQTLGRRVLRDYSIAVVFLLVVVTLSILSPRFLTPANISNVLQQVSMVGIIAMGMTMLLISGNFDLSVGGQVAFIAVASALTINAAGLLVGILLAVTLGTLCGVTNALLVGPLRVNSLIATLGSGLAFRGLAFIVAGSQPVVLTDQGLRDIVSSRLLGIPTPVVCFAAVVIVATWFLHFTIGGREFFAVGANPDAARYAGLRVRQVRIVSFVVTGSLCAVSALILTGLLNTGLPGAAASWPLDVIAAVVVGGVSIAGGRGSTYMAVIGVLLIGVVNNGFNLLNLDPNLYSVFTGVIIVGAVASDGFLQRSARASLNRAAALPDQRAETRLAPESEPGRTEGGGR